MDISKQIQINNVPAYDFRKVIFLIHYNIKHITGIPHNSTEKAIVERSNHMLKELLRNPKRDMRTPKDRLHHVLLTLNI